MFLPVDEAAANDPYTRESVPSECPLINQNCPCPAKYKKIGIKAQQITK
jgi:hypothetical protein